jgi:sugar phosphate isomerase/epimerase
MNTTHSLSRRNFLAIAGAMPFAASALAEAQSFKNVPVGIELYSVRWAREGPAGNRHGGREDGLSGRGVLLAVFSWTPAQAKEVRTLLDDLGIKCHSTHNGGVADARRHVESHRAEPDHRSTNIIIASPPGPRATVADWKAIAERLTAASERLRPLKMAAGYHNHQYEWPAIEGQRPMDILAAGTPKDFVLQFDVGTCVEMGADPIAWIKANPGRIKSVHCKDWSKAQGYAVAFGEGDSPWKAIFSACESVGGVEYYLVEQEVSPDQIAWRTAWTTGRS